MTIVTSQQFAELTNSLPCSFYPVNLKLVITTTVPVCVSTTIGFIRNLCPNTTNTATLKVVDIKYAIRAYIQLGNVVSLNCFLPPIPVINSNSKVWNVPNIDVVIVSIFKELSTVPLSRINTNCTGKPTEQTTTLSN